MKNILKDIGLSLSAACSCSADKCWGCGKNDGEAEKQGLCQQCVEIYICRNCGKLENTCVAAGTCMECFQHECSQCGIVLPSVEYDAASYRNLCEQCRKTQQNPFGM